ncbi:uncharacterized protein K02A2.6-like [Sabethes cyaneus]|uniref:uncharacterized protein K02A2.6-like n=1 Tax=Sabethes cyaneus TaxID=53552 RepID=UPI00237E855B|nr:uncharacterized protein K02A2.6-like [Sabethes cyaneus]XP_053689882.1 uncharacterized protein K02A2.6-like [Sabethes cyaneus]
MALMGTIDPYVFGTSFSNYVERLEYFFSCNDIPQDKKKDIFMSFSGMHVFEELKLLYPGIELRTLTYEAITKKLKERFDKIESDTILRHKFRSRKQGATETGENFILAVKLLAEQCDFGEFRDSAIKDQLIYGIYDKKLQKDILEIDNLTLRIVEQKIKNKEIIMSSTSALNSDYNTGVNAVRNRLGNRESDYRPRNSVDRGRDRFRGRDRMNNSYHRGNDRRRSRSGRRNSSRGRYANFICNFCNRKGHIQKNCYRYKNQRKNSVKFIAETPSSDNVYDYFKKLRVDYGSDDSPGDYPCLMIRSINRIAEPCFLEADIEGRLIKMEIDSGSSVSVMSKSDFFKQLLNVPLKNNNRKLLVVNGSTLEILGSAFVRVSTNNREALLELIILNSEHRFTPLMGRDWLDVFCEGWRQHFSNIFSINATFPKNRSEMIVSNIKDNYKSIFDKNLSTPIIGFEADLVLREDTPIFKKAYQVPYRLKEKVDNYLIKLEKDKIISPIKTSLWASPVIAVMKKDNTIRLVIDCKVSINKVLIQNTYPLPLAQDLFASLSDCSCFCSLDLSNAYTQLNLSEKSRKFVVINTSRGLFTYNRLPQGASSSAAIFQQIMDTVLKGLDMVFCYLDDVLVAGRDFEDCHKRLLLVLDRLHETNIKVNFDKCKFFVKELPYLGHVISGEGLKPNPEKVATIQQAKKPENVTQLKAFLGLINYYGKFLPNLSAILSPLYKLLLKDVKYVWSSICDKAFNECKLQLLNASLLVLYDPKKPIIVCADASSYGLGGVIAHTIGGVERPISFTSFSLNTAQKTYPILHLEALAIVSTIKKFHKYLYGQKFTVYTDHKPLLGIFGKSGRNSIFVTRLQRYIMELSIYNFDILYRPSDKMSNADFCSRFPLSNEVPKAVDSYSVNSLNFSIELPLDSSVIAKETQNDQYLQQVIYFTKHGWPERLERSFRNIYSQHKDLEITDGCLVFQNRVVIPFSLQNKMLKLLHANHVGIIKMKQLARRYLYWFGINNDIERYVKKCDVCAKMVSVPGQNLTFKWTPTTRPFSRIHADFFYHERNVFLLIVDSFSKWLEVIWMKYGTEAEKVIKNMQSLFTRFGLPDVVVTDNGPPFNSQQFISFLERQGIKVMKSPPYHPQSNGQAERLVRVAKDILKKFLLDPEIKSLSIQDKLDYFLFGYRNTCLTEGGDFPSERVLCYKPKTLLDLTNPNKNFKKMIKQSKFDDEEKHVQFEKALKDPFNKLVSGDKVYYRNHNMKETQKWLEATFVKRISLNTLQISIGSALISAHRGQIKLSETERRRNTALQLDRFTPTLCRGSKRRHEGSDDDEPFRGFSPNLELPVPTRNEVHPNVLRSKDSRVQHDSSRSNSDKDLRRSSRARKKKFDGSYVYYK